MATQNERDFREHFGKMLVAAARVVNEKRAAGEPAVDANPYDKFLLPAQVTEHQPSGPLLDESAVSKAVNDGMESLNGGGFGEFVERVLGVGIKLLTGGVA